MGDNRIGMVKTRLYRVLNGRDVLPAHGDAIRAAILEIDNLVNSYLECCAENDRLRAMVANYRSMNQ